MLTAAKFEFFLINKNIELARIEEKAGFQKLTGVEWGKLAAFIEKKYQFSKFDFNGCPFSFLSKEVPQYLVKSKNGIPSWDSNEVIVDSWDKLLSRGYAQFRNNVAHGNKAQLPSQFTEDRTEKFLQASLALISFIATDVFDEPQWEGSILFR
jgi:hypothetical protein